MGEEGGEEETTLREDKERWRHVSAIRPRAGAGGRENPPRKTYCKNKINLLSLPTGDTLNTNSASKGSR